MMRETSKNEVKMKRKMGWIGTVALIAVACAAASDEALFGSAAALRSYVAETRLAERHVGLGFDVTSGVLTHRRIFQSSPAFHLDLLSARTRVDVAPLRSPVDVHELLTREWLDLDFVRGMMARSPPPYFSPASHGQGCFLAVRTDEHLAMRLRPPVGAPEEGLARALAALPDTFDEERESAVWEDFFSLFPAHYVAGAVLGGRVAVSARGEGLDGRHTESLRVLLDELLRGGRASSQSHLVSHLASRIRVMGGDVDALGASVAQFSPERLAGWLDSVKRAPAVVGFRVRPVSDFAPTLAKKRALNAAIEARLRRVFEVWRGEAVLHEEAVRLQLDAKQALRGEVSQLQVSFPFSFLFFFCRCFPRCSWLRCTHAWPLSSRPWSAARSWRRAFRRMPSVVVPRVGPIKRPSLIATVGRASWNTWWRSWPPVR